MSLTKFDYVVDQNHGILTGSVAATEHLSKLCPVMVGKIRELLSRDSSAKLLLILDNTTKYLMFATILGDDRSILPVDIQRKLFEAEVFSAATLEELAKRYAAGTLDPVYHAADDAAVEAARKAVEAEKAAANASQPVASATP